MLCAAALIHRGETAAMAGLLATPLNTRGFFGTRVPVTIKPQRVRRPHCWRMTATQPCGCSPPLTAPPAASQAAAPCSLQVFAGRIVSGRGACSRGPGGQERPPRRRARAARRRAARSLGSLHQPSQRPCWPLLVALRLCRATRARPPAWPCRPQPAAPGRPPRAAGPRQAVGALRAHRQPQAGADTHAREDR